MPTNSELRALLAEWERDLRFQLGKVPIDAETYRLINDKLNRIAGALAEREDGGWMPIETAPKDHLPILVCGPYGRLVAFKDITWAWWPVPANEKLDYVPTHWQPLPPPQERKV